MIIVVYSIDFKVILRSKFKKMMLLVLIEKVHSKSCQDFEYHLEDLNKKNNKIIQILYIIISLENILNIYQLHHRIHQMKYMVDTLL